MSAQDDINRAFADTEQAMRDAAGSDLVRHTELATRLELSDSEGHILGFLLGRLHARSVGSSALREFLDITLRILDRATTKEDPA